MDSSSSKKVINQTQPFQKILGLFFSCGAIGFIYVVSTLSDPTGNADFDRTSNAVTFFQTLIGLAGVFGGLFIAFSKKEVVYDEKTVEYRTIVLGKVFSRVVDRELLRDVGPEALGLIQPPRRRHF